MGEVAAYTGALREHIARGRSGRRGADLVVDMGVDPDADCRHACMTGRQAAEQFLRGVRQQVGLTISRRHKVLQHLVGQLPDRYLARGQVVDFDATAHAGPVVQLEEPQCHLQPGTTVQLCRIVVHMQGHGRRHGQRLSNHCLVAPVQRVNLEQEVSRAIDLIGQQAIDIEFLAARQVWRCRIDVQGFLVPSLTDFLTSPTTCWALPSASRT